jgi:hypothetical protein
MVELRAVAVDETQASFQPEAAPCIPPEAKATPATPGGLE